MDILETIKNIKWGISKNEYKKLFSKKNFVDYYPEEKNAFTFVEINDDAYISVSAFFIFHDNVHKLASIGISFFDPSYKRLEDKISQTLFEKNKQVLMSIYGNPDIIIDNPPAESYLSKFINWKTENSIISITLQLSKDYRSLFLSKNILSEKSNINTMPSIGINIVDIQKEKEITDYISNQSIAMKKSQQNELEKDLEKLYVPMFQEKMKISLSQAQNIFNEMLNRVKKDSGGTDTVNLPNNYGDILLNEESTNKKIKFGLDQKRIEGVTNEDIKWWWNTPDLSRRMALAMDAANKYAMHELMKKNGLSDDDAWEKIPKYCPIFGDPYDSSNSDNKHDPLPFELMNRINIYVEKRIKINPEQFKEEIENSPNFNSLIREEIKKNNI